MKEECIQILKIKFDIFKNLILVPELNLLLEKDEQFTQNGNSSNVSWMGSVETFLD